jgi:hypothetical protein
MDLSESVRENFDVNFVVKELPAYPQFKIWWIKLDQRDTCTKHKHQVFVLPAHPPCLRLSDFVYGVV